MKKKIELLSPVGDFECLKAAVQNGANAVYLGAANFNARYSAKNFSLEELEEAINYAHLRNVKVFLTLNTLIKNEELNDALNLATKAYELGIDSIIVQDIGLAHLLLKNFPDLPIHSSTQMTCHNLSGAKVLEKSGFKRIVLARELSLSEIEYIRANIKCEIEVFTHGALCISYSGQCLYSSLIGGRSGNRGKCAQGCRLPYSLLENNDKVIDKGYLLSPKDLCSLELLPELINTGIDSLKIEGRMKTPEYVATVTRIYRKYIDKLYNEEPYIIEEQDKKDLLQVFNRGSFSTGHLSDEPNKELIFKERPNNMGLYIGNVSKYNANKGHITLSLNDTICIGDTITFENEDTKYTISELMQDNKNLLSATENMKITIGRMKGNIKPGDKIFKLSSKELINNVKDILSKENIKNLINAIVDIHLNKPITLQIFDSNKHKVVVNSSDMPEIAKNNPITKERLEKQLNKLNDTPFYFENIKINLDDNIFVPHISTINELRRTAINEYTAKLVNEFRRNSKKVINLPTLKISNDIIEKEHNISLLLNILNLDFDYSKLENVDKLYIPLKYFSMKEYSNILQVLVDNFNTYIYIPTIIKPNFRNLLKDTIDKSLKNYNIKGFVASNIGNFHLLREYLKDYEFIGNYNLNVFNNETINNLNVSTITISPELNKDEINSIAINSGIPTEFIVYGNIPLMTSNYCLLGKTNKCYPECSQKCQTDNKYHLKDRMNFLFRLIPDNLQTITTIYNSKINFIETNEINNVTNFRIDILDESIDEINNIINTVNQGKRLEGKEYTNGNLNRDV